MSLRIVPVSFADACDFTAMWHRHHGHVLPRGSKFCQGAADERDILRGVAITGRPVARHEQDGVTVEVTRCTTDGTEHACSMLYGAAARAAKDLGWRRVLTYTEDGESGASLRAAGFVLVAVLRARSGWDTPSRRRADHGTGGVLRYRWERIVAPEARPWTVPARPEEPTAREIPPTLLEAS